MMAPFLCLHSLYKPSIKELAISEAPELEYRSGQRQKNQRHVVEDSRRITALSYFFAGGAIGKKSPFLFATFSFGEAKEKVGADGQDWAGKKYRDIKFLIYNQKTGNFSTTGNYTKIPLKLATVLHLGHFQFFSKSAITGNLPPQPQHQIITATSPIHYHPASTL